MASVHDSSLLLAIERAGCAVGRLDNALDGHPLSAAFLYRARLEAVRRQAAVDGQSIDPWHLAAVLEGLRLRMEGALRIIDRGSIFEAARTALNLHQWIVEPDFDQEGEVQSALRHLETAAPNARLLTGGLQLRAWLEAGGARAPIRAALIRFWVKRGLLRQPIPLTGPRSLSAEAPDDPGEWICAFLDAVTEEAGGYLEMLRGMERSWVTARREGAGQRTTSRASQAIDVMAASPLLSATTLARALGVSIKSATVMLDGFVGKGVAVEVTHRSARRLFGLPGMTPVRDVTAAPRRPQPGRGRGRPRHEPEADRQEGPPSSLPPVVRLEHPAIDYTALDAAMLECEQVIRLTRSRLANPPV